MAGAVGAALYEDPSHLVDIYLPDDSTMDSGGGVKLNWPTTPSQENCPASINSREGRTVTRQDRPGNTVANRLGIYTAVLEVELVAGTKFITTGPFDPGRTLIMIGFSSPNRPYGNLSTDIPALTYVDCEELR